MAKQLVALRQFTDKQGTTHQKDERFEIQNDQEAQEYIKTGDARASA